MKNKQLKFSEFELEKLSKNQKKAIRGGDGEDPIDPQNDPKRHGGNGNG